MDQTPLTLPTRASLHLAVSYFQKIGLRYLLFSDRGVLQGLLTRKDASYLLNGADETRRTTSLSGAVREEQHGDQRSLLRSDEADDDDPLEEEQHRGPIL
jgi:chloride channel 3/4/5